MELFNTLAQSQIGKDLVAYLETLEDEICDSRNWGPDDTKESALQAAKVIREKLRNRIRPEKKSTPYVSEAE
jgi:hypothetical protein